MVWLLPLESRIRCCLSFSKDCLQLRLVYIPFFFSFLRAPYLSRTGPRLLVVDAALLVLCVLEGAGRTRDHTEQGARGSSLMQYALRRP